MSMIRIGRDALEEVELGLRQYTEILAELERTGVIKPLTHKTYSLHSANFVRWLRGEFEPGARNKA